VVGRQVKSLSERIVKLHILGCGDAFGSGGRNQSGYLVEAANRLFLLDCGPTTLLAMKKAGFDPQRLDVIFLSHLHGDHFGGIPFFFIEYLYQKPRHRPLHIAGPLGTEEKVCELFGLMYGHGSGARRIPPTRFHLLQPEASAIVEGINVFSFRVPHQVQEISLALKVSCDGKQILFSGDSTWTDRFLEHARGADLFLCECSFYDAGTGNHLNYLQLREYLPLLRCKQLVLTHLGEEMLARRKEIAETVAEDGMVVEI
jgi:ribonuclease BN (tRNA processing enzyme)